MTLSPKKIAELKLEFPPKYPIATEGQLIKLRDGNWNDYSVMKQLTCINHLWVRYLTKDPWERSIHYIQGPNGLSSYIDDECKCPFTDLRVVIEKEENNA